jgi:hypothetical protein
MDKKRQEQQHGGGKKGVRGAYADAPFELPAHTGPSFGIEAQSSPFAVMQAGRAIGC